MYSNAADMSFIVTVPNAATAARLFAMALPTADVRAYAAATALCNRLARAGVTAIGPIVGDTNHMAKMAFRNTLKCEITAENRRGEWPFVVQMHTFGPGEWWGCSGPVAPAIVLLDDRRWHNIPGVPELLKALLPADLAIATRVGGSVVNDGISTARASGASGAVVVSLSEAAYDDGEKLGAVVGTLANSMILLQSKLLFARNGFRERFRTIDAWEDPPGGFVL
jgi:hypothetical protein